MCLGIGLFFFLFLLVRFKYDQSNLSLMVLLLILILNLSYAVILQNKYIRHLPNVYFIFNKGHLLHLLVYPFFLSFIQSYTRDKIQKKFILILFIPSIYILIQALANFYYSDPNLIQERVTLFLTNSRPNPPRIFRSIFLLIVSFIIPGIVLLKCTNELKEYFSKGVLRKTKQLLVLFIGLLCLILMFRIFSYPLQYWVYNMTKKPFLVWDFEVIFCCLFIVLLCILFLRQFSLDSLGKVEFSGIKYAASKLTKSRMQQLVDTVETKVINEKYYLSHKLTISDLSEELNVNAKYLSQAINQVMGKNFNEFINECRIDLSKELILSKKFDQLTVDGISKEVGFSSRATFYRVFKKETGMTPIQYRKLYVVSKPESRH